MCCSKILIVTKGDQSTVLADIERSLIQDNHMHHG